MLFLQWIISENETLRPSPSLAQGGPARKSCIYTRKSITKFKPSFESQAARAKCGPSYNTRVDARHRRPAAAPRDLARASPALFAEKVLTHHKHLRKSTPPLRKTPSAQKALRALRPWLGHAGSTKFDRPQKRERFWGARTSPIRQRCAKAPSCPASFHKSLFSARGLMPTGLRKYALYNGHSSDTFKLKNTAAGNFQKK